MVLTYAGGTKEEIQPLIIELEEDISRHVSIGAVDMGQWKVLVPDPGHTRGKETQYK